MVVTEVDEIKVFEYLHQINHSLGLAQTKLADIKREGVDVQDVQEHIVMALMLLDEMIGKDGNLKKVFHIPKR